MRLRFGLGPVFGLESVAVSRRWQLYFGRVVFVSFLLGSLWFIWQVAGGQVLRINDARRLGTQFFAVVVTVQLLMVMLAAPAVTAGSVCVDKVRGTLHHVFVTDLSNREIILGKLGSRLLSVFAMMACCAPVLSLSGLLGGLDYEALLRAYAITSGVAVFSCSLALFFSIWVKKPHQALIPTYAVLGLWCGTVIVYLMTAGFRGMNILDPTFRFLMMSNPLSSVAATYAVDDPTRWVQPLVFLATMLTLSAVLIAISVARLRRVVIGQGDAPRKNRHRADAPLRILNLIPGPPLDADPILWREWHRKRPGKWTGRAWMVYGVVSILASALAIYGFFTDPMSLGTRAFATLVSVAGVTIGLLLLTISATTSLGEERDRGSLDVIMTTPLSSASIIKGKWLGTFAMVPRLAILPLWINSGLALISGEWPAPFVLLGLILAYSAVIASLGLALATWIPRVGRAIATALFVLVFLNALLIYGHRYISDYFGMTASMRYYGWNSGPSQDWLLLGSPIHGITEVSNWAGRLPWRNDVNTWDYHLGRNTAYTAALIWVAGLSGFAGLMYAATIASFDRCLGRMTTDIRIGEPPRLDPEAKGKAAALPEPT